LRSQVMIPIPMWIAMASFGFYTKPWRVRLIP
jgi:hypothetical protein